MDDKLIIETLIDAIKEGKFTLEQVPVDLQEQVKNGTLNINDLPLKWRELVQEELEQ